MHTTEAQWEALLDRQRCAEENGLALGGQRFRKRLEAADQNGQSTTAGAMRRLFVEAVDPTARAIETFIQESEARKAAKGGAMHVAIRWVKQVGIDTAAFMAVKVILDQAYEKREVRHVAAEIAKRITDELRYRRFQEDAPALFRYAMNRFHTSSYTHMARSLTATMNYAQVDVSDLHLPPLQQLLVGTKLIDLFVTATGLVEVNTRIVHRKSKKDRLSRELVIEPTADTLEWLTKRNGMLEFLQPVDVPMVVPPLAWAPGVRGGYRFALLGKHSLVRAISPEHERVVSETDMPHVYSALNAVQNTAWRINPAVFSLVNAITRRGQAFAGLPAFDDSPLPAKPVDIDSNDEARRLWRKAAHDVRSANIARAGKAMSVSRVLAAASAVQDELAIYFPSNLDFRGRVYPIATHLSPQGNDLCRGLLTFALGKPLGEDGPAWLAVHGANVLGETPQGEKTSKMTLQERADWITKHSDDIRAVATDPFTHDWWTNADKPLQFYAFAVEWTQYLDAHAAGRGAEFVSSLPVAQDGTCNGLQHFSAMLRDELGGRYVNLIPSERPEDVYARIAETAAGKCEQMAVSGEPADAWCAARWLSSGLITRKLAKRPTMTFGYGSKRYGFREQLEEFLKGQDTWLDIEAHFTQDGESRVRDACALMSGIIWDCLKETVVAAFDGMAWMQSAARLVAKNGRCVQWQVPGTGFQVRQEYFKNKQKQIETILSGRMVRPSVFERTDKVESYKQANAVAPNFVHSLDAAALMLTVTQAASEGVESFGMVHDSYATLPADCSVLARATRQSFVRLYSDHNVIGEFYAQLLPQMSSPDDCPPPPTVGALDVASVLASDYFFS